MTSSEVFLLNENNCEIYVNVFRVKCKIIIVIYNSFIYNQTILPRGGYL